MYCLLNSAFLDVVLDVILKRTKLAYWWGAVGVGRTDKNTICFWTLLTYECNPKLKTLTNPGTCSVGVYHITTPHYIV